MSFARECRSRFSSIKSLCAMKRGGRDGDIGVERYGNSDIGVECEQWFVRNSLCERMVSEKTVRPTAEERCGEAMTAKARA
jgi:hypothetical protein